MLKRGNSKLFLNWLNLLFIGDRMNVLIVHAHPEPKSFTSSLRDLAVEHFQNRGDDVVVSDLYAMQFDPVGIKKDFKSFGNPDYFSYLKEQMNAYKSESFTDEIKSEMDKLVKADLLLLNFPLWWSSAPAILKGWFDRVFAFGFAYHPKDMAYETGAFKGKKAMCCITTGGSKEAYSESGEHGDIMNIIYHINHGLLYFTGMSVLPPFFSWKAHLLPEIELKKYIEGYKVHLNNFDNLKPIY